MDKAELSRLLEQKVQEKIMDGYSITTYALDAAARDRVKHGLLPHTHAVPLEDHEEEVWQAYIKQVEEGTYQPERRKPGIVIASAAAKESTQVECGRSNSGLWKARRH